MVPPGQRIAQTCARLIVRCMVRWMLLSVALARCEMTAPNIAIYELLNQMLQASERGDLAQAEKLLKQALDADPENMEALRHAAGFYQIVKKDPARARQYAALCRVQASAVTAQMDEILGQSGKSTQPPAARHIGGIIGPY